jgi:hypothetical protein
MRNNKVIIAIVVALAVLIGAVLIIKSFASKKAPVKAAAAAAKKSPAAPQKKAISKGSGALTVKTMNSKNAEVPVRVRAFRACDSKSSVYAASTAAGRTQELLPGIYDIELDTTPPKIVKDIKVNEGRETVEDLGCVTGSLTVRTINAKKAPAYYPLRILGAKTSEMVAASMTNKALEIVPGVYDIEVGVSPRQYKKDVKVEAGKEVTVDLGCLTGILTVKVADENKKDVRCTVRITRSDTNEIVSSTTSNKPVELGKGKYNIDIMSAPRQSKKDVIINTSEESTVEFTVSAAPAAAAVSKPKAAPSKPKAAAPAKTKQ